MQGVSGGGGGVLIITSKSKYLIIKWSVEMLSIKSGTISEGYPKRDLCKSIITPH